MVLSRIRTINNIIHKYIYAFLLILLYYNVSSITKCYVILDDLTIDYQFTFNLSKKDDLRFTQINFQNSPSKSDVDADFSITCSVMAKMNITVRPGMI